MAGGSGWGRAGELSAGVSASWGEDATAGVVGRGWDDLDLSDVRGILLGAPDWAIGVGEGEDDCACGGLGDE